MGLSTTTKFQLTRRTALLGGAGLATAWLTGCDLSTDPAGSDDGGGDSGTGKGKEAPDLAQRVEAGDLPPVEERLPDSPLVVEPTQGMGVYGGTWATAILGAADAAWIRNTMGYEPLVRWNEAWDDIIPNVAESFEVDDTGREFTFVLRAGMKWSDGEPFTADDIVFAYEDVLSDPDIFPAGAPPEFRDPSGNPAQLEKVDDHTVRFVFAEPKGLFLEELAPPTGLNIVMCPRHYLEQFHQKYNPGVADLASQEGISWIELIERKRIPWENAELPTLFGWQVSTAVGSGSRVVAERNPYYWKTDPEGSQLPYIDEVVYNVVESSEVMLLQATNGDLSMHARTINNSSNRPVLADGRSDGGYDFFELTLAGMNDMIVMLNLNHKDPDLRSVFQSKDFRIGLSHAINREEMINAVFQQQGEARQGAPGRDSPYYDEEFATQYVDFDVAKANQHLDDAGLSERDGDGFRLFPNGNRAAFTVEVAVPAPIDTWEPSMELVKGYWAEVGIDIRVNGQDRSIWTTLVEANDHDACVWGGAGGMRNEILDGFYYLPFHEAGSRYALLWAQWYASGGERGEEPPAEVQRQLDLYDQALGTIDRDERQAVFAEVVQIAREQFYVIGTVASVTSYGIVANDFHNVPESMPSANAYGTPGPTRPEQYYIAEG